MSVCDAVVPGHVFTWHVLGSDAVFDTFRAMSRRRGGFRILADSQGVAARTPEVPPASSTRLVDLSAGQASELVESLRIASMSSVFQEVSAAIREWHGAVKKREAVALALGRAWKSLNSASIRLAFPRCSLQSACSNL